MSPFIEVFSRGLSENISFRIVPMFSHSFLKSSTGHANILAHRLVWTIGLHTSPVVYAVGSFTADRLNDSVFVSFSGKWAGYYGPWLTTILGCANKENIIIIKKIIQILSSCNNISMYIYIYIFI